jgi:hypothetical protein
VSVRFVAPSIVVLVCLAAPGRAAAHARTPTVALDYRLGLSQPSFSGVHAEIVDGDRAFRVRADPPHRLLVRGLLGEPLLRIGPTGAWVRTGAALVVGVVATALGLGSLSVFWHGVVISSLPAVLIPSDSRVRR